MAAPLVRQVFTTKTYILNQVGTVLGAFLPTTRGASKKAGTSTKNKRKRTPGKHRGPKKFEGDYVEPGMILCRQLGLKFYPGENVNCGGDLTLLAAERGRVMLSTEILSPYPESPLYPAVKAGRVVHKTFYHVIKEPQQQIFKLVSQT